MARPAMKAVRIVEMANDVAPSVRKRRRVQTTW